MPIVHRHAPPLSCATRRTPKVTRRFSRPSLIWSTPSLFQFYLNRYYDPFAQNFYRYSRRLSRDSAVRDLSLSARAGRGSIWRIFGACLIPALPNVVHQITQTLSLYYMGPGVYAIFTRSSVIMTALLALIFFPEERWIIRQWQFQVGTLSVC